MQSTLLSYNLKARDNLSSGERSALDLLLHDESRVILPADKGNVIIVMDFDDYATKCIELVSADSKTYSLVDDSSLSTFSHLFNSTLRQLRKSGAISEDFLKSTRSASSSFALFYGLPKIHKIENLSHLDRKTILTKLKIRPITSACGFVTYRLQQRLVPILKLLEDHSADSFSVKNVYDFIERVRGKYLSADLVLVSFDVESMFTSVPVKECLNLIGERLKELGPRIESEFNMSPETVLRLLRLCGTMLFQLPSGERFEQLWGFPMGGPISPLVCSFYIHHVETKALNTWSGPPPLWWLRYVDDTSSSIPRPLVGTFLSHLNSIDPNIRWTVEIELDNRISFLDCLILRAGSSLKFTLHRKPTATSRYIDATSCCAVQHKRAWILSTLYRIDHIADPEFRDALQQQLFEIAKINGYTHRFVEDCIARHHERSRPPSPVPSPPSPSPSSPPLSSPPLSSPPPSPSADCGFNPSLPFASIPFLPGLTNKLRQITKGILNVVSKPLTLWRLLLKKAKFKSPVTPGEVYIRKCRDCASEYTGETGLPLQKRTEQHDKALEEHEPNKSAIAWHGLRHGHSFFPPVPVKRVRSLPKRRFFEALIGRICPPSFSINAELAANETDSKNSSAGRLWLIDFGWILVALAKGIRSFVEKKISDFLTPTVPTPQSLFTPLDGSLSPLLLPLHLQAPPTSICAPPVTATPVPVLISSRTISTLSPGEPLWTLRINVSGNVGVFVSTVKFTSPLAVLFANGQIERNVHLSRVRPRLPGDIRPRPWIQLSHWPQSGSTVPSCASPPPGVGTSVFVDTCLDPNHVANWSSPARPRSITSQRFVNCVHGRCKVCCQLFCRSTMDNCTYHHIRHSVSPHLARPDEDHRSKRTRFR